MTPGQIDVNDPSSRDVAFRSLFFLFWNHRSALAKMRGTPAINPYLTLPLVEAALQAGYWWMIEELTVK